MAPRMACTQCGAERVIGPTCPVCRCPFVKSVAPTPGDATAITADLVKAAEAVDRQLLEHGTIHRSHVAARALAAHCRELALVRNGVCPR